MKVAVYRMQGPYFLLKVALGETWDLIFFLKVAAYRTPIYIILKKIITFLESTVSSNGEILKVAVIKTKASIFSPKVALSKT